MSLTGSAQISPRILSAYERLEKAVNHLGEAVAAQGPKVDLGEYQKLQKQLKGLEEDNLALSQELESFSETDYDSQFEELKDKISALQEDKESLESTNQALKEINSDFSQRLEKLIGNVEQILEEE